MGIIQFWTRGCNSRSGFHGQLNKMVRLTQNHKVINAYNWPPILVSWRAAAVSFLLEMHQQGLRHLWIASILSHRLSYKPGISDSFFLSDRESFEICSSWARRTLPALSVHHLRCAARALSTTFAVLLVAGEGRKVSVGQEIQLRKLFQPSATKIAYILVASIGIK